MHDEPGCLLLAFETLQVLVSQRKLQVLSCSQVSHLPVTSMLRMDCIPTMAGECSGTSWTSCALNKPVCLYKVLTLSYSIKTNLLLKFEQMQRSISWIMQSYATLSRVKPCNIHLSLALSWSTHSMSPEDSCVHWENTSNSWKNIWNITRKGCITIYCVHYEFSLLFA